MLSPNRRLRRGPVTDLLLWIELMAYQKTIVRAYWSFSGDGWVTYDFCYSGGGLDLHCEAG